MKWLLLSMILIASPMAFCADCYWAVSLSCQLEQPTQYNDIDVVVSANFEQGKNTCPDSGIVGLNAAYMLQDKLMIGKVCRTNEAGQLFRDTDSFGVYALLFTTQNSRSPVADAQEKAKQNTQHCLDANYTSRCMIVDEYAPISIQSYMTPAR